MRSFWQLTVSGRENAVFQCCSHWLHFPRPTGEGEKGGGGEEDGGKEVWRRKWKRKRRRRRMTMRRKRIIRYNKIGLNLFSKKRKWKLKKASWEGGEREFEEGRAWIWWQNIVFMNEIFKKKHFKKEFWSSLPVYFLRTSRLFYRSFIFFLKPQ